MILKTSYAVLDICLCIPFSVGQNVFLKNGNHFTTGISGINSDSSTSAQLIKEKFSQPHPEPTIPFFQVPFQTTGSSSSRIQNNQIPPFSNLSPVEIFVTEFQSAVYTSKVLPVIFDLRELSAEAFSKSLYDYVYANSVDYAHNNPHYIASMVATPVTEGIDTYSLPVMLDIYGNAIAKYLFAKGVLNASNASSLARKYAKFVEESSERNWAKDSPESKFLTLEDGFVDYMISLDQYNVDTLEDLAFYFSNEVKRVAKCF